MCTSYSICFEYKHQETNRPSFLSAGNSKSFATHGVQQGVITLKSTITKYSHETNNI